MCEFISWKTYKDVLYFLTDDTIKPKLKAFKDYNANWREDLPGHGAIDWFFGLLEDCGRKKECTDFSTPDNFPEEIVEALKSGKMTFGQFPYGLLRAPLGADYEAKRASLDADYEAKWASLGADFQANRAPLDVDYQAKRVSLNVDYKAKLDALGADYEAKRVSLNVDYKAKLAPLYADYEAKWASLHADYEAKLDALILKQWKLFMNRENRCEVWR